MLTVLLSLRPGLLGVRAILHSCIVVRIVLRVLLLELVRLDEKHASAHELTGCYLF